MFKQLNFKHSSYIACLILDAEFHVKVFRSWRCLYLNKALCFFFFWCLHEEMWSLGVKGVWVEAARWKVLLSPLTTLLDGVRVSYCHPKALACLVSWLAHWGAHWLSLSGSSSQAPVQQNAMEFIIVVQHSLGGCQLGPFHRHLYLHVKCGKTTERLFSPLSIVILCLSCSAMFCSSDRNSRDSAHPSFS